MIDWKKADAEKLLREALNRIYATPQEAFMDGSYKRVKEAIIFSIDKALSKCEQNILEEMATDVNKMTGGNMMFANWKALLQFIEEKARQTWSLMPEPKDSGTKEIIRANTPLWLRELFKREVVVAAHTKCSNLDCGNNADYLCFACAKKSSQQFRGTGRIEGKDEERKRIQVVIDEFMRYHFEDNESDHSTMTVHKSDVLVLKQKLEESE